MFYIIVTCNLFMYLTLSFSDPRVRTWPMMSSPFPTLFICLFYAYFSRVLGPIIMENRKPFQLKKILIYYNAFQTLFSAWIFYEVSALHNIFLRFKVLQNFSNELCQVFLNFPESVIQNMKKNV